jgi:DNA end-binding protein Ku
MQEKGRAGIARVVMARRERMILLEPLGKGIVATLLRYPYEVRGEDAYFESIPDLKLPAEMKNLAGHIIETKAADFDPSQFEDRYEKAVVDLIQSKQGGRAPKTPQAPKPSNVVNLMDALRKSVDADRPAGKTKTSVHKTSARRAPAKSAPAKSAARKGRTPARGQARKAS